MIPKSSNQDNQTNQGSDILILLASLLLFFSAPSFAGETSTVRYIPARDYFSVAYREINSAKSSVRVVLYLFSLYPNFPQSQTMQVANALVSAAKRGCSVDVVLDKGEFSPNTGDPAEPGDNRNAYEYLAGRGVQVGFADAKAIVHAKAMIIDSQTVIIGSANWSESAFTRNYEASALIRDAGVARAALKELGGLKVITPPSDSEAVPLSLEFFADSGAVGKMVTSQDERAYDLYLYLQRLASSSFFTPHSWPVSHSSNRQLSTVNRQPFHSFVLNYDSTASHLGIATMTREEYRRQINKVLAKLQDRYKLVTVKTGYGKDAEIQMPQMAGETIGVSEKYWDWAWPGRLDFPGKVMYMLNLHYSKVSLSTPQWSMAADTIAKRHGLTRWFVITGTTSLRRANLVDVAYDSLAERVDGPRRPNVYTPLPLYDPALLDAKWVGLQTKYGKDKTDRARACAALVYKDCDYDAVEKFILLEQKYGLAKMQQAEKIIGEKAPDNPRRCVGYFIGVVMGLK